MRKTAILLAISLCIAVILAAFAGCNDDFNTEKPSLSESDGWRMTYSDDFSDFSSLEEVWEKTSWSPVQHGERREGYWCDETLKLDTEEGALVVSSFRDGTLSAMSSRRTERFPAACGAGISSSRRSDTLKPR